MAKMSPDSDSGPTSQLKFPKPSTVTRLPVPGDDNFEAQLLAALERITAAIADVQNTLEILIVTLTMEEPATGGSPVTFAIGPTPESCRHERIANMPTVARNLCLDCRAVLDMMTGRPVQA